MDGLTKSVILWRQPNVYDSHSFYPPAKCTNINIKALSGCKISLTWTDPDDIVVYGGTLTVKWAKTVVVRKIGSYPTNENDGTLVLSSTTKNQYQTSPYIDSGLVDGTTYYYAVFSCSSDGMYNREVEHAFATARTYKVMTVQFNITANPEYGTFLDDAVDMPYGKDTYAVNEWQEFFGYKPCQFKNGAVVGYLNPNDYTQFEDGSTASGNGVDNGDVMVEFPRRGIKITKSGTTVTVSMTDNPNDSNYSYLSHKRGNINKDYFYIGTYLASTAMPTGSSVIGLYSAGNGIPEYRITASELRTYANNRGDGYMEVGFYQFLFLQCMYLLQFKGNLDSQAMVGQGYVIKAMVGHNGDTYDKGLIYGTDRVANDTNPDDHMKLFGIEDFWGNLMWFVDGFYIDSNYHILTATDNFNDTGEGYTDFGTVCGRASKSGCIDDCVCNTDVGFSPTALSWHESPSVDTENYFCDYGNISNGCCLYVGGSYSGNNTNSGIFQFLTVRGDIGGDYYGGRLAYL